MESVTTIDGMKQEVMQAFQRGEDWAFNEIYRRFVKPIEKYVLSRVVSEAVAQEITQEIFLKAFRFSSSYQVGFAFTTWLWTIARNTVTDFRRRPAGSPRLQSEQISAEETPSRSPDAEALLARKSLRKKIFQMTRMLTPMQRRILWFRVVVQLPYQEISRRLGLTASAARSTVHRALGQLEGAGVLANLGELL